MPKTASERKAAQRERQRNAGVTRMELLLDNQEYDMLMRNCAIRRPGREPYDIVEYLQFLIRKDDADVKEQLEKLGKKKCGKCGEQLPVKECCMSGDSSCWATYGWHELKLTAS